jgi:hypothetical protein
MVYISTTVPMGVPQGTRLFMVSISSTISNLVMSEPTHLDTEIDTSRSQHVDPSSHAITIWHLNPRVTIGCLSTPADHSSTPSHASYEMPMRVDRFYTSPMSQIPHTNRLVVRG